MVAAHRRTCAGASGDQDLIELQSDQTGWPLTTIGSEATTLTVPKHHELVCFDRDQSLT